MRSSGRVSIFAFALIVLISLIVSGNAGYFDLEDIKEQFQNIRVGEKDE